MFNPYDFGDYLIGTLHPAVRVYVDGRVQLAGPQRMRGYLEALRQGGARFEGEASRYSVAMVLVDIKDPTFDVLSAWLGSSSAWALVYLDDQFGLFVRSGDQRFEAAVRRDRFNVLRATRDFGYVERFPEASLDSAGAEAGRLLRSGRAPALANALLGAVSERQGRLEEAARSYAAAQAAEPEAAVHPLCLARVRLRMGDTAGASAAIEEALALSPAWEPALRLQRDIAGH
jgi:tetratricopeptide (TPR) repeat protein